MKLNLMKREKSTKREGKLYDRIFKENAESLFIPLVQEELKLEISSYRVLPDKIPKTVEREVDFLYEIISVDGSNWILHIEFQTKDAKNMIYRMGMYHGLVLEKYKKPVKHVVIYLGEGEAKMPIALEPAEIFEGFDLINVNELDTEKLLRSRVPEVILLAMLSKYEKKRSERVLRLIIEKIQRHSGSDKLVSKYISQLLILSKLRNLGMVQ